MSAYEKYETAPRYEGQVFAIPIWATKSFCPVLTRILSLLSPAAAVGIVVVFSSRDISNLDIAVLLLLFNLIWLGWLAWPLNSIVYGMPIWFYRRGLTQYAIDRRPKLGTEADYEAALQYTGWLGIFRSPKRLPDTPK